MVEDWLETLRQACAEQSQTMVARRLGVSQPVVNRLVRGSQRARLQQYEQLVREKLMAKDVACPVLNTRIPITRCERNRRPGRIVQGGWLDHKLKEHCPVCEHNPNRRTTK